MFWNKKNSRLVNIIFAVLCVLLLAVFGMILVSNAKKEQAETEKLSEIAGKEETGIEDYEGVQKHAAEIAEQAKEEENASEQEENTNNKQESDADASQNSNSEKKETAEETAANETEKKEPAGIQNSNSEKKETAEETAANETEKKEPAGIVCWGDDLINGEASSTSSYMAVLTSLLTENGYNLPVINKTLQGGGTLSMMKMAGVSDEVLQGYITEHKQAAGNGEPYVTETGIRDLTAEQTERNDLECIPVIFMGYYGGWNHDPAELAEQQELILNTFPDKERFLVVGTRPVDGSVTAEELDQVMSQKWGNHYISFASVTSEAAASDSGQKALAQAIFQKLEELGYISKG